jgi:hypothetical protein
MTPQRSKEISHVPIERRQGSGLAVPSDLQILRWLASRRGRRRGGGANGLVKGVAALGCKRGPAWAVCGLTI